MHRWIHSVLLPLLLLQGPRGCQCKRVLSYAGPYRVVVDKWYQCPQNKNNDKIRINMIPHRPRQVNSGIQQITGNVTIRTPLDDTYWFNVKMDLWNANQWKENAFLFKFPNKGCTAIRSNIPDFWKQVTNLDPYTNEPCYIGKGEYVVEKATVNWTFPNFPVLPYGTYRLAFTLGEKRQKNVPSGCTTVESILLPAGVTAPHSYRSVQPVLRPGTWDRGI